VSPRPALCLLVLAGLPAPVAADWLGVWPPPSPLTTAQEIRHLTPDQADRRLPVKLTGVVTHHNPADNVFYLQDKTAGIRVLAAAAGAGLARGDLVEVEGITDKGEFAPCVSPRSVKKLGTDQLPHPLAYNLSVEDSRWMDGQWVQVWVVVHHARSEAGATRIHVFTPQGRAELVVPGAQWAVAARQMRQQVLIVSGVCVATFEGRRVSGPPTILLSELPKPPPEPIDPPREPDAPPRMIDHLLRFTPYPHPGARRVKINGVVTAAPLPDILLVQDATGGALVQVANPPARVEVGTRVEAYGLLRVEGRRVALTHAAVKPLGRAEPPAELPTRAAELAAGTGDATRVRLTGRVEEVREVEGWTAVALTDDGVRFEAYVPGGLEQTKLGDLETGSRVEVVGVAVHVTPDRRVPTAPAVFLPEPAALQVLGGPPRAWWTSKRVGYAIGGLAAALLLGGGWLLALRVQVRRAAGEVKRQYEEKAFLERQLREASKLEAVGRLAGGIAHDFNNLLTVINGCAELIAEQTTRDGGKLSELTDDIRKAGERAASLTGQLLTFSRKREVMISAVNLNDAVAEAVRLLDRVLGENIRIETTLAADLPAVRGEAGLLNQVLMNLATNARDAMPHGGVLSLATSVVTESADDGHSGTPRQFVRLTVSDTGVGMPEEVKARIFEPFFTTKDVGDGTGLGLATVYGIIKTVHGRIRVDSEVGRGTTFHIDFRPHGEPVSHTELVLPTLPTPLPPSRVVNTTKLAGTTVLVVEDSELVRATLATGLVAEGATVLTASRPDHALRLVAAHDGPIDVLVTDVVMPGMSGPALAERVRETRPGVRVVFISGYTADEVLRQGVLEDQVEFIQKPFTPDHLTRRLLRILERGGTPAARE
jgi:signal transduction histidine kinase/CheY-like chemotaxis protein